MLLRDIQTKKDLLKLCKNKNIYNMSVETYRDTEHSKVYLIKYYDTPICCFIGECLISIKGVKDTFISHTTCFRLKYINVIADYVCKTFKEYIHILKINNIVCNMGLIK